jgi:RNA polymerase sigma-70 factor (ECF subfamily)
VSGEDGQDLIDLERTARGDRAAFGGIVTRHGAALFHFARRLTGDDAAAEDVLQDTLVSALRHADQHRGEGSVRAWLFGIARRRAWDHRRRDRLEPTSEASLEALGLAAGWGSEPGLEASVGNREQLERALGALSPEDREVLLLRDVLGFEGEEAARALGLGLPALKSRLHRARLRFAAALREGKGDGQGS